MRSPGYPHAGRPSSDRCKARQVGKALALGEVVPLPVPVRVGNPGRPHLEARFNSVPKIVFRRAGGFQLSEFAIQLPESLRHVLSRKAHIGDRRSSASMPGRCAYEAFGWLNLSQLGSRH